MRQGQYGTVPCQSKLDGCIRGIWNKETYSGVIFRNVQVPSVPAIKFCIALMISCYEICMESLYTSSSKWVPSQVSLALAAAGCAAGGSKMTQFVFGSDANVITQVHHATPRSLCVQRQLHLRHPRRHCHAKLSLQRKNQLENAWEMTQLRILQISILGLTYHLDLKLNFFYNAIA